MSQTKHLQTCAALATLLGAADPALADGGVHAGRRTRPVAEQHRRQVNVYLDYAKPTRGDTSYSPIDWGTRIRVECAARAGDGLTGEEAADALAARVFALADANALNELLAGDLMDFEPVGLAWDTEEADAQMGVVSVLFDAKFRTASNSLT